MKPLALLTLAALLAAFTFPARSAEPPRKLNVLFIVVDDLNTDLGCYGHPRVQTPNIDRLAARGVRFDRAYCQYPLCSPSRVSFLSGRRPETTGVLSNNPQLGKKQIEKLKGLFLHEHFGRHGYFTASVGKVLHENQGASLQWDFSANPPARTTGGLHPMPTDHEDGQEVDGQIARRAVQLFEPSRDRPFFIAVGFHRPHEPLVAPRKYFDLHRPEDVSLPQAPDDDRQDIPRIALPRVKDKEPATDAEKREAIAAYHACVSFLDAQVGVLMEGLEKARRHDDTIVVLFGDHGFHLGEHGGIWFKETLFEEATRVPLIIAAPRKGQGMVSPHPAELLDLYPTLGELCGLPLPDGLHGTSLAPLLDDPGRSVKKAAFTVLSRGEKLARSIRTERFRYTEWPDGSAELYDHEIDPREWNNLAANPAQAEVVAEMRHLLEDGWKGAEPQRKNRR